MIARVLRPAITFTTVAAVLAAALAVYAFMSAGATHADSAFTPSLQIRMCNALPAAFSSTDASLAGTGPGCAETLTAGAATDYTTITTFPVGNLNFSNVVTMSPNAPTAVAAGTKVGGLRSLTNLGLINGTCSTALVVDFVLYNTALPDATTRAAMTNIAWPQPEGTTNRHSIWRVDAGTHTSNPPDPSDSEWAQPTDTAVTGGSIADGTNLAFLNYPHHLLDLFDPDFVVGVADNPGGGGDPNGATDAQPKIPTAAYGGMTLIAGTWIPLYFLVFPATGANSLGGGVPMPAPLGEITSSMGFPSVSVLTDPSAAIASPSTITDFCVGGSVLEITAMLKGIIHTNPAAGTQMFVQYASSQRDTDQESYENQIDTCPGIASGNPSTGAGDADADRIADACDTNGPYAGSSCVANGGPTCSDVDVDDDGFQNAQDNCPQVVNFLQTDSEAGVQPPDKGPRTDGIGDACDSELGVLSVLQNPVNTTGPAPTAISITMSDTVANGRYMSKSNHVAKCFDAGPEVDVDGDGYCGAGAAGIGGETAALDGGVGAACLLPTNSCFVRHTLWSASPPFLGGIHPGAQMDADGDTVAADVGGPSNWSDVIESYLGTDPTKPCAQSSTANNEGPLDNWPLDMDDNRLVNGTDYQKYNTVLNGANGGNRGVNVGGNGDGTLTTPATVTVPAMGTVSQVRFDLNLDGFLSGADQGKFNSYITDGLCDGVGGSLNNVPATLGGTFQQ